MATVNDSLVEHFTFDRGRLTGRVAGVALTNNNGVTFPAGRIGHAADCERGSTQYLSCASNATVQMSDINWAIACWVKMESLPAAGEQRMIIAKDSNVAGNREYIIDIHATVTPLWHFRFFVLNSAGSFVFAEQTATTLSTGRWYHLLAQHNADTNTVTLLVDGSANSAATAGLVPNSGAADLRIGSRVFNTLQDYFDGQIDDVRFYKNRVFTVNEVGALMRWRPNTAHSPARSPVRSPVHSPTYRRY